LKPSSLRLPSFRVFSRRKKPRADPQTSQPEVSTCTTSCVTSETHVGDAAPVPVRARLPPPSVMLSPTAEAAVRRCGLRDPQPRPESVVDLSWPLGRRALSSDSARASSTSRGMAITGAPAARVVSSSDTALHTECGDTVAGQADSDSLASANQDLRLALAGLDTANDAAIAQMLQEEERTRLDMDRASPPPPADSPSLMLAIGLVVQERNSRNDRRQRRENERAAGQRSASQPPTSDTREGIRLGDDRLQQAGSNSRRIIPPPPPHSWAPLHPSQQAPPRAQRPRVLIIPRPPDDATVSACSSTGPGEPCVACYDRTADACIIPCGHVVVCMGCAAKLQQPRCPMCRLAISQIVGTAPRRSASPRAGGECRFPL